MPFELPDDVRRDEACPHDTLGDFIYVPLAWRTGQDQFSTPAGVGAEIEGALRYLHGTYLDLPIPDRLLDLVQRRQG
jgi:hypothetical protein